MPLLHLPAELLINIISHLGWSEQRSLASLAATSRAAREFALPKLYQTPYSTDWRLIRTLYENPGLGRYVQEFTLHCDDIGDEDEQAGWFADVEYEKKLVPDTALLWSERDETARREQFLLQLLPKLGIPPDSPLWRASVGTGSWGGWCFLFLYVMPNLQILSINSSAHAIRLLFPAFLDPAHDSPTPVPRCLSTLHTIIHTTPHPPRHFQMGPATLYPLVFLPSIRSITLSRPIAFSLNPAREELRVRQNALPAYIPTDFRSTLRCLTILASFLPPSALECILRLTPDLEHFRHDDAIDVDAWGPSEYLGPVLHRTLRHSLVSLDLRRLSPEERIAQIDLSDLAPSQRELYLQDMIDLENSEYNEMNCFVQWIPEFERLKSLMLNVKYWNRGSRTALLGEQDEGVHFPSNLQSFTLTDAGESWRNR